MRRASEASNFSLGFPKKKKPLLSGSDDHRVSKIKDKTIFRTMYVCLRVCVIGCVIQHRANDWWGCSCWLSLVQVVCFVWAFARARDSEGGGWGGWGCGIKQFDESKLGMTSSCICICLACRRERCTHASISNISPSLFFILRCAWHARINMHSKKRSDGGGGIVLIPGTTVVISRQIHEYYYNEARERSKHFFPWFSKEEKGSS